MDPGLLSLRACVKLIFTMVYVPLSAHCFETDPSCPCPPIPTVPNTQPPTQGCYQIGKTFRYKCMDGLVRTAGTSNMIKCNSEHEWSKPSLKCKEDPTLTTTTKRTTTTTSPVPPVIKLPSTMISETEHIEITSTAPPPLHTTELPLQTTTLPQTSTNTPSTLSSSTSSPVTPQRFNSTPTVSSPPPTTPTVSSPPPTTPTVSSPPPTTPTTTTTTTTPHEPRRLDLTTSPSSLSSQGKDAVVTNVVSAVAVVGILIAAAVGAFILNRRRPRNSPKRNKEHNEENEENIPMNNENHNSLPT